MSAGRFSFVAVTYREGQYTDPTGLIYLRARYFDPTTAQMLSVDPEVDRTRAAYAYAEGDPVNRTDPTGNLPCSTAGTQSVTFEDPIPLHVLLINAPQYALALDVSSEVTISGTVSGNHELGYTTDGTTMGFNYRDQNDLPVSLEYDWSLKSVTFSGTLAHKSVKVGKTQLTTADDAGISQDGLYFSQTTTASTDSEIDKQDVEIADKVTVKVAVKYVRSLLASESEIDIDIPATVVGPVEDDYRVYGLQITE